MIGEKTRKKRNLIQKSCGSTKCSNIIRTKKTYKNHVSAYFRFQKMVKNHGPIEKRIKLREIGGGNFPKMHNRVFDVRIGPYLGHYEFNDGKNNVTKGKNTYFYYKIDWVKLPKTVEWVGNFDKLYFDLKTNRMYLGDDDYEVSFV